jgi:hypothetical protein
VILTPGNAVPLASFTVPETDVCAAAVTPNKSIIIEISGFMFINIKYKYKVVYNIN